MAGNGNATAVAFPAKMDVTTALTDFFIAGPFERAQ